MKNIFPVLAFGVLSFVAATHAQAQNEACTELSQITAAAQEYFKDIRGEATTFDIRGVAKPYQKSKVEIKKGVIMYITEDEWYPEAISYLASTRFYSPELQAEYDRMKKLLADCLGDGWVMVEKDKTNDIYLEDTEYKKAIFSENKKGKKVKIELFMYNQRELDTWTVEFKVQGLGKTITAPAPAAE
jgi:hypothetical protein